MKSVFRATAAILAICFCIVAVAITYQVVFSRFFTTSTKSKSHVAIVDLTGIIISSSKLTKELEELVKRDNVKAIVLRINSPGGVVAPSQEIYEALKKTDEKKLTEIGENLQPIWVY